MGNVDLLLVQTQSMDTENTNSDKSNKDKKYNSSEKGRIRSQKYDAKRKDDPNRRAYQRDYHRLLTLKKKLEAESLVNTEDD